MARGKGTLVAAFMASCVSGAASVVGVGLGLTVAPAILPVAAAVAAGSLVVGGITNIALGLGRIRW